MSSTNGDSPVKAASDEPLLAARDLKVHFEAPRGTVHAVDGVTMAIEAGETLGVVGESGSGKTVLSRALMGLVRDGGTAHVTGAIRFEGIDTATLDPKALRRLWGTEMAMVFQDPMTSLDPLFTVGEQVAGKRSTPTLTNESRPTCRTSGSKPMPLAARRSSRRGVKCRPAVGAAAEPSMSAKTV